MDSSMVITWLLVLRIVESKALLMSFAERMLMTPSLVLVMIANHLISVVIWFDSDRDLSSSSSFVVSSSSLVISMINCDILDRIMLSGSGFHLLWASPSSNRVSMSIFDANASVR